MNLFIAYAHSDTRFANRLALDLLKRGFNVWIEPDDASKTDPQRRRLDLMEGMASSDAFIVALSPTSQISPEWNAQLDYALERGKPMWIVQRQHTELMRDAALKLRGMRMIDMSLTRHEAGLAELLELLGGDPGIDTSRVFLQDAENWLPGVWDVLFENRGTKVEGNAKFTFAQDGRTTGLVQTMHGRTLIQLDVTGKWHMAGRRFTVQGQSAMSMSIEDAILPQNMTYMLVLTVVDLQPGEFRATSSIGDRVIFRKQPAMP